MSERPVYVVDKVFDEFKLFAQKIFNTVAEPRSFALIIDWQIGQNDFPAGIVINRTDNTFTNTELYTLLHQLSKFATKLSTLTFDVLNNVKEQHAQKLNQLIELQKSLTTLENKYKQLEESVKTLS